MGACAGKHKKMIKESNRKQQNREFRVSRTRAHRKGKDEQDNAPSSTKLYDLPLEVLDMILKKSYLHWILDSSTKQKDEYVCKSLISVDVCFNRRITRIRFKKEILRYLKDFYERNRKRSKICRNNKDFLLKNIQPNDEFIDSLFSLNCITEEQRHFIQRQNSNQDKNAELLKVVRSFDDDKQFKNFARCLLQTNQSKVAKIVENGGVVIRVRVEHFGATSAEFINTQMLHQMVNDLRSRTRLRSQTKRLISQLKNEDIEILTSQLKRKTVVVSIWCGSQVALETIQNLYESNKLRDVFFENIQPSTTKRMKIDRNEFQKTVVVCPIFIEFTERIEMPENEFVCGVTKLRNEIYVLCRLHNYSRNAICVFEDRAPFHNQNVIEIKEMGDPFDIGSSQKENCLYVQDYYGECVWKIRRESDNQYEIKKWLTIDYYPSALSVSSDGQLLLGSWASSILRIYGSDAEIIRSIQLPRDIEFPRHAVETSIGNFVISHEWKEKEDVEESLSTVRESIHKWVVSELSRDGQTVIRRFIPSNEAQQLNGPKYFSLDSDNRVFVVDSGNGRVILLDSDLRWNRILLPTDKETTETMSRKPNRLCYDQKNKQLIVVEVYGAITIYRLNL